MEETEFLQELLECSICLEQLTCQSKVLPKCQHTFCTKCLAEIMQTQNELRCPECRLDYPNIKSLDELPHNILLIRLLEGLKQNMRNKNSRMGKTPNQTPIKHEFGKLSVLQSQQTPNQRQQLVANKSAVLQQLSGANNGAMPGPSLTLMHPSAQQQYVSPRQLTASNGQQLVYGNAPSLPTSAPPYSLQANRRSHQQLSLDNTLIKHPLSQQENGQLPQASVKTPTSSIAQNLPPALPNSSMTSPNNNLAMSKPILVSKNTSCKQAAIQSHSYSTLPSSMSSAIYQPLVNTVNNGVNNSRPQSVGIQPQQYFSQLSLCRALYDFRVADVNDKNCLSFKKSDIITLIRRIDDNWLEGSLDNSIGIFPITFVEFLPTIRPGTRNSQSSNPQTLQQTTGLPPVYQSRIQIAQQPQSTNSLASNRNPASISHSRSNSVSLVNGGGNGNAQMNGSSVHHRCNSKTNSNGSHQTNPKLALHQSTLPTSQFGNLDATANLTALSGSSSSNSYDNLLDIKPAQSTANLYIALYNYKPQKKDELELKKNELYVVHEKCHDGWYKGSSVKDNKTGVFPGNYLLPTKNNSQPSSYQNVVANRRSFGNLGSAKFDSADNLLGNVSGEFANYTKPKQLTSSIGNNLSDLDNTMSKMTLNGSNAKSENYLTSQQNQRNGHHANHSSISKSVEQLNNDNGTVYESLVGNKPSSGLKRSNDSISSNSPQWIQPKVAATRSASKQNSSKQTSQLELPYSLVFNNGDLSNELRIEITTNSNNTTHIIKEVVNTPIKKEEKKVGLIKMFTGKRSNKADKHRSAFSYDNPIQLDISPKN